MIFDLCALILGAVAAGLAAWRGAPPDWMLRPPPAWDIGDAPPAFFDQRGETYGGRAAIDRFKTGHMHAVVCGSRAVGGSSLDPASALLSYDGDAAADAAEG